MARRYDFYVLTIQIIKRSAEMRYIYVLNYPLLTDVNNKPTNRLNFLRGNSSILRLLYYFWGIF